MPALRAVLHVRAMLINIIIYNMAGVNEIDMTNRKIVFPILKL